MGKAFSGVSKIVGQVPLIGKPAQKIIGIHEDMLLGEKDPGTADQVIDVADPQGRKLQSRLLEQYGSGIGTDTNKLAQIQSGQQEAQAIQDAKDAEMRTNQLIAQRGLGRSSIGLGQALGQQQNLQKRIASIRANQPLLAEQLRQQNLNFATGGINQILGEQGQSKILKMGREGGQRTGGFAPLIGGILGAKFGPGGAQAGLGIGQALTQS